MSFIDDMKETTKVQREINVADIFDLSFVREHRTKIQQLEALASRAGGSLVLDCAALGSFTSP